jgi:hypothetical protein
MQKRGYYVSALPSGSGAESESAVVRLRNRFISRTITAVKIDVVQVN